MGWTDGQGLGANNQGLTEIIKVKKKDDSKGLGFKENSEQWLKTTSEYNELLDKLGSEVGDKETDITSSLEDRSRKSKARVHYHKFTRGKDLSRYSAKDLASIIGPNVVKTKSENDGDYTSNQVNRGSLADYFKSKKESGQTQPIQDDNLLGEENDIAQEKSEKVEKHPNKCKKLKDTKSQFITNANLEDDAAFEGKMKRKSCFNNEMEENTVSDLGDASFKKKRKKMKNAIGNIDYLEKSSELLETNQINDNVSSHINDNNYSESKLKKKKFKTESLSETNQTSMEHNISPEVCSGNSEEYDNKEIKKRKRKRKNQNDDKTVKGDEILMTNSNESLIFPGKNVVEKNMMQEEHSEIGQESADVNEKPDLKTKKKKKKSHDKVDNSILFENTELLIEEENNDLNNKRSEKKNKHKQDNTMISLEEFMEKESTSLVNSEKLCKNKTKNKVKHNFDTILSGTGNITPEENPEPLPKVEKKLKKMKLKKETEIEAIEEPVTITQELRKKPKKDKKLEKEQEQCQNEEAMLNGDKGCMPVESHEFMKVLGRQTRLKKIKIPHKPAHNLKYETEEFMAFGANESYSKPAYKSQNKLTQILPSGVKNSEVQRVHATPDYNDFNTPKSVVIYEYRLLSKKMKELNLTLPNIKVIIDCQNLPLTTKKKLIKINKCKQIKSLLPADALEEIEAGVRRYAAQLQPKINMIHTLEKIKEKTQLLGENLLETSPVEGKDLSGEKGLSSKSTEMLETMSQQLTLLCKEKSKKSGIKTDADGRVLKKALQTRIEENLKELAEQMKRLKQGHQPLPSDNEQRSFTNYSSKGRWNTSRGRGRGVQGQMAFDRSDDLKLWSECLETTNSYRGTFSRGRFRGRGRRDLLRGRISQNNFDAKIYAERCKELNKVPEITFNGVDLKAISGYAAISNIESSNNNLSPAKNPEVCLEVIIDKES